MLLFLFTHINGGDFYEIQIKRSRKCYYTWNRSASRCCRGNSPYRKGYIIKCKDLQDKRAIPLIVKAARSYDVIHIVALSIFILSMILLYAASTIYHSVDSTEKVNRRLRKMDHMMIFVMIAGSYTPVCLIVLHNHIGYILCALVWSVAILGIILKGCWITCPKWLSSVLYIGMGWLCVLAFVPIFHALPRAGFDWLLAGGIIYTIGGVIYALKVPLFDSRHKSSTFLSCLEVPATLL